MMQQQQLQRPITSGSRQAPDPYDQFLESRCLYRKHTARDASSLFRVIAEQMYDTQMLNYEVRLECVRFMTLKRRYFAQDVGGDFDSYMHDMTKPKTYGTMLELRAMCCMYRRNVILFEPFNMGTIVTFNSRYRDYFRIFYTNENHFDSVYQLDYVQMGAICQSITYKLLYTMLFKLPDVSYAVERMLHPDTLEWDTCDVDVDKRGYILRIRCYDGRIFQLDLPENTKCILENYKMCSFHNNLLPPQTMQRASNNGAQVKFDNADNLKSTTSQNDGNELQQMCPNRFVSCVRQLLDDGITPFPYKVAKSLDPFMYRNVEFDCWNDVRKEAKRFNSYAGDYDFKVPYESMHPLPPDEFRPWTLPLRCQRQLQRMHLSKFVTKSNKLHKWKKNKMFDMGNYFEATKCDIVQMHQYIQLDHCYHSMNEQAAAHHHHQQQQQQQHQQQQLREDGELQLQPLAATQEAREHERAPNSQHRHQQQVATCASVQDTTAPVIPVPAIHTHFMNYLPMQPGGPNNTITPDGQVVPAWATGSPLAIHEEFQYPIVPPPVQSGGAPVPADGNCLFMPFGGVYGPPPPAIPALSLQPQPMPLSMAPPQFLPSFSHPMQPPPATSSSSQPGAVEPRRSLHFNGGDLPADVGTLRYFYNMGVDMHMRMAQQLTPVDEMSVLNYNNNNTDQSQQQQQQQQQQHQTSTAEEQVNPSTTTATPPPSPDANNNNNGTMLDPSNAAMAEKTNHRSKHRNNATNSHHNNNKPRTKRPEHLKDLSDNHHQLVTAFLPTPTPSPNTNGKQFNFYGSPSVIPPMMATYIGPQIMQPPPHSAGPPGSAGAVPFFFTNQADHQLLMARLIMAGV
ncbi:protein ovarian tumor locus isoform X2 [Drosophila tropicalis]|uniref:protein ovarian tumor locus isoform X2 n=1 Tax=Drosophila tropicalis TaxID=46794 RepID=UPI0035ABB116